MLPHRFTPIVLAVVSAFCFAVTSQPMRAQEAVLHEIPAANITASSYDSNGRPNRPWLSFDGDLNTKWCTRKGPAHWLEVDLGTALTVRRIVLRHAGFGERDRDTWEANLRDFTIRVREFPDVPWTDLLQIRDNPPTAEAGITERDVTSTVARWLRLDVERTSDGHARVPELEVWVSAVPDGPPMRVAVNPLAGITPAKDSTLYIVAQSHIDVAWLWRYDPETIEECCLPTFRRALANLDRFPDYRFTQSQVPLYAPLETRYPDLFARIREHVTTGRWEIAGGHYLEFEGAGPDGESLVRHCLYGKRYFRAKFGVEVTTAWQEDAWTHPRTLPQILRKSGIKSYMFKRGMKGDHLFWWESPDGSRVLACLPTRDTTPEGMAEFAAFFKERYGVDCAMIRIGGGDHGGGPDANEIERVRRDAQAAAGRARFARFDEFVAAVLKQTPSLPTLRDELGFEYEGGYTTCGELKTGNRRSERLLLAAEKFSAAAARAVEHTYPHDALTNSWQGTLLNQFHDTMAGCVIPPAYEDALAIYREIEQQAGRDLDGALRALAGRIDTGASGRPVIVFNPHSWPRTDVVEVAVPESLRAGEIVITAPGGEVRPVQITAVGGREPKLVFTADEVPSLGYKTFVLKEQVPFPTTSPVRASIEMIESPYFRVEIDPETGDLAAILDKRMEWQVLAPGKRGNRIDVLEDTGDSEGAIQLTGKTWELGRPTEIRVVENGPVRATVRIRSKLGQRGPSVFVRDVTLYAGVPRIDFRLSIEWNDAHKMVKVAFPINAETDKATYEIPYGTVSRASEGKERPALRWVDVSDGGRGAALLNDSRYGYDVKDSVIRLSVLRSPTEPAHNDDGGIHVVGYSLVPHAGGCTDAQVVRRGYEFDAPLLAVAAAPHAGDLPTAGSFARVEPANVILSALKKAEDSDEWIARFYETDGRACEARFQMTPPLTQAVETDLLERDFGPVDLKDGAAVFPIRAFEIKTLKIR